MADFPFKFLSSKIAKMNLQDHINPHHREVEEKKSFGIKNDRVESIKCSALKSNFLKQFLPPTFIISQSPKKTTIKQQNYPPEEEAFLIKNKDTGSVYDIRNIKTVEELNSQLEGLNKCKQKAWKNYWKEMQKIKEELWDSAEDGNLKALQSILLRKSSTFPLDVNARCLDNWSALHLACNEGHYEVAKLLIEHGSDIEAKTSMERRPLHFVAMKGFHEILMLLIEKNCFLNAQDMDFCTPLHHAAERGHETIVKELLEAGADWKLKNHQKMTAVDLSFNIQTREIFLEFLRKQNLSYDSDNFGRTAFGYCIRSNSRVDYVKRLLLVGKDQEVCDHNKNEQKIVEKSNFDKIIVEEKRIGVESFDFYKILGKGSFGEVYLVTKKGSARKYAMKVLQKEKVCHKNLLTYVKSERNVLSIIKHPFMVSLHSAFQNKECLFLVMDYCSGEDLEKQLSRRKKTLTEQEAKFYICEVLLALESLHDSHIVYRDLKPANIVLDGEGHLKLTDFGLSKQGIASNVTNSFCGSVAYLAPEVLCQKGHNRTVDWYLLGVLLYEFLVGVPPYYSKNRQTLFENIKYGELLVPKHISAESKDLLKGLLCRDPKNRLGAQGDAKEIKAHPWFNDIDWKKVLAKEYKPPLFFRKIEELGSPLKINFEKKQASQEKIVADSNKVANWTIVIGDEKNPGE